MMREHARSQPKEEPSGEHHHAWQNVSGDRKWRHTSRGRHRLGLREKEADNAAGDIFDRYEPCINRVESYRQNCSIVSSHMARFHLTRCRRKFVIKDENLSSISAG